MKNWGLLGGAALFLGSASAWGADRDEPLVLEPSTPWNVHYADDFCRLSRSFGTGDQEMVLVIDRLQPGDAFRLMLAGDPMKRTMKEEAQIRFGADLPVQTLRFFPGKLGKDKAAWIFRAGVRIRAYSDAEKDELKQRGLEDFSTPQITQAEEAAVEEIRIGRPLSRPLVLRTRSMKGPFAALRACNDELLTHWGVDVARHRELSEIATPSKSPAHWLTFRDYPADMLREGMPGLVNFRLTVGADGKPKDCHVQQSTHPEGFDRVVCSALMRNARFNPARDQKGEPITSYYVNSVTFVIQF
jgi:TonB family protein